MGGIRHIEKRSSVVVTAHDVTDQRHMFERVVNLNRTLALLSEINQDVVRTTDMNILFERCCRAAVEKGEFKMAWIGIIDGATKAVRPVASCGDSGGFLDGITVTVNEEPEGFGPVASAIKRGEVVVIDDMAVDPRTGPWRERAARNDFHSAVGIPIRMHGRPFGGMGIFATDAAVFVGGKKLCLSGRSAMTYRSPSRRSTTGASI